MDKIKILFVSASPRDEEHLRVTTEFRNIQDAIKLAPHGSHVEWRADLQCQANDLINHLLEYKPDIVHISCHGEKNGLLFIGQDGNAHFVDKELVRKIFQNQLHDIKLVVLNACHADTQAQAIADFVGCAVGIKKEIYDSSAVMFPPLFYKGLVNGSSVRDAFDLCKMGLDAAGKGSQADLITLHNSSDVDARQLYLPKPRGKGYKIFKFPHLWNSYTQLFLFTKQVHDMCQFLNTRYMTELIDVISEIERAGGIRRITHLTTTWKNFQAEQSRHVQQINLSFKNDYARETKEAVSTFSSYKDFLGELFVKNCASHHAAICEFLEGLFECSNEVDLTMSANLYSPTKKKCETLAPYITAIDQHVKLLLDESNMLLGLLIEELVSGGY